MTVAGAPAGYFELRRDRDGGVEIAYFGLLPEFTGRGLGGHLLTAAVERAWAPGPERVWLHTNTLDHPAALPNYLKRGFTAFHSEDVHAGSRSDRTHIIRESDAPLWTPSAERVAAANLTAFMRDASNSSGASPLADYRALYDFSLDPSRGVLAVGLGRSPASAATMGERVVDDLDRMPGARFFPDARLNFAENLLRADRRRSGDRVQRREQVHRTHDGWRSCAARSARSPPALRRAGIRRRRSRRRLHARTCRRRSSPRSARRRSARSGRRARRTSACRACSIASGRSSRACSSRPTATSTAARRTTAWRKVATGPRRAADASSATVVVPYVGELPDIDARARRRAVGRVPRRRTRRAALRALPFNHPLYILYSSGHDRRAQVHRARRRRHADPAPEGAPAPLRHQARRSRLLLHDLRLDDVELAGHGARVRRDAAALRRLAVSPGRQRAVRLRRRDRR